MTILAQRTFVQNVGIDVTDVNLMSPVGSISKEALTI